MPTRAEFESLRDAGIEWRLHNGVDGRFLGTAPNQIFLPVTGGMRRATDSALILVTSSYYWTSTQGTANTRAENISFSNTATDFNLWGADRAAAMAVRCVVE